MTEPVKAVAVHNLVAHVFRTEAKNHVRVRIVAGRCADKLGRAQKTTRIHPNVRVPGNGEHDVLAMFLQDRTNAQIQDFVRPAGIEGKVPKHKRR